MPATTFKGDVQDASGAATILSVSGEDFDFSNTFDGTFWNSILGVASLL